MKKYFNIAGPCNPDEHYMMPSEARCKGIAQLIDQKQYFVIHAARQSGKTTLLLDLAKKFNDSGKYYALYCSLESVQEISEPEKGIPAIVRRLTSEVKNNDATESYSFAEKADFSDYTNVLREELVHFCKKLRKPLVILFDEADCLSNGTLITFLRQLRDGYVNRFRTPFVNSIGLIGMRNIRDYKGKIREDRQSLGSASPFNIVTKSMTLLNFTQDEVRQLYDQHTEATGQIFPPDVIGMIYQYTQGQPWLINAVASEIITEILESDYSKEIRADHVQPAVDAIIRRRDTHIDSLMERLKEDRVRKIVEPVITGDQVFFDPLDDDFQYVLDLGLLKQENGRIKPSNPIYEEVIIRYLGMTAPQSTENLPYQIQVYVADNKLNMKKLLTDFQDFWRENSAIWIERFLYKEAAPHLILMAFLHRIINCGGTITREMAAGTKRVDLCIHFMENLYPVELKLRYDRHTLTEGKRQITEYMDTLGCNEGWLVVFDKRKKQSWKSKLFWKTENVEGKRVHIVGC